MLDGKHKSEMFFSYKMNYKMQLVKFLIFQDSVFYKNLFKKKK